MYRDDEFRREVHMAYKIHQMEQNRLREEYEKKSRTKAIRRGVSKAIAFVMMWVFCITLSALDAYPLGAGIGLVISTVYLAVYAAARGALRW